MSEKNPLHPCASEKPELYESVRLYFENEEDTTGRWTGRYWWSCGREVAPLAWQYLDPHPAGAPTELHGFRN